MIILFHWSAYKSKSNCDYFKCKLYNKARSKLALLQFTIEVLVFSFNEISEVKYLSHFSKTRTQAPSFTMYKISNSPCHAITFCYCYKAYKVKLILDNKLKLYYCSI